MKIFHLVFDYPEQGMFYNKWFTDIDKVTEYIDQKNKHLKGQIVWVPTKADEIDEYTIRTQILYVGDDIAYFDPKKCYLEEINVWITSESISHIDYNVPYSNWTEFANCTLTDTIREEKYYDIRIEGYYDKYTDFHKFHTVSFTLGVRTNTKYLEVMLSDESVFDTLIVARLEPYKLGDYLADKYSTYDYDSDECLEWIYPLVSI